jgi:DNA polymerase-4
MIEILDQLAVKIENILKRDGREGMTVTLKVRYFDFQSITRSITVKCQDIDDPSLTVKSARTSMTL